ncbi:polymer-forming cytoskeletal protein [Paenibacillus qinlingensis]|uniref:Cytoskeletal protein CcmA (Bactofilin family) n=1 Tax=Paenibacillus qinlingensis TaxID=1837343 RepID=A0ABU1P433_9BACL|nr:polymer-forming cytoskeletal protein [Paenibacillus qinlingensis]MDR6554495.1 cytoskeletal protein CcmA (bactofilin family) [Paenibacillus qinlingensis]
MHSAELKRNLMISGIGSSNGGSFRTVKIDGLGRLEGDVICSHFTLNGRGEVNGSIQSETAEMNGTLTIQGDLKAKRTRIHGRVKVEGNYFGENIEIHGASTITGSCEAEKFHANGKLHVGTLNADTIQVTLHGHCKISEIGGERIQIRKQPGISFASLLKILPAAIGNHLTCQTIEGDHIYLEYTTADVVRGANITIGPGCEIGLIEYTVKLEQDKKSKVKISEKV